MYVECTELLSYSTHILNTGHRHGALTDTVVIRTTQARKISKHIGKISHVDQQREQQMNNTNTGAHNPIYRALQVANTRKHKTYAAL
jgi:hypothetical protein